MLIGLDYGEARIGVAVAEKLGTLAVPHSIIQNKGRDFILAEIKKIIAENDAATIVIGMPVSMQDREIMSEQKKRVENFVAFLKNNLDIEIKIFDERLTSMEADKLMIGNAKGKSKDDIAAMIILQAYLDKFMPT